MKYLLLICLLVTGQIFAQTHIVKNKDHLIAFLNNNDSEVLYHSLNVEEVLKGDDLVKTMGPTDKLIHISCKQSQNYSCIMMLKLYNLKENKKIYARGYYLATEVDADKIDEWYAQFNYPIRQIAKNHWHKEFLTNDEKAYLNCRLKNGVKVCKLGIQL